MKWDVPLFVADEDGMLHCQVGSLELVANMEKIFKALFFINFAVVVRLRLLIFVCGRYEVNLSNNSATIDCIFSQIISHYSQFLAKLYSIIVTYTLTW